MSYISTKELSSYLGVSVATIKRWRKAGDGPPFKRIGMSLIRYKKEEVELWLEGVVTEPMKTSLES